MKNYGILILLLMCTQLSLGDTIWSESFETDGDGGSRYQSSNSFNDGNNDHFNRTNGSDIAGTYSSPDNSYF